MSDSALERQAEPQGNLVSRKAVINTLESMYNACDNNCYDLYLLLKESYEVLPSPYSDIEAIYNAGYKDGEHDGYYSTLIADGREPEHYGKRLVGIKK